MGGLDTLLLLAALTGGWILLSITVYFWSLEAENDSVVPGLTLSATLRGTLSKTFFVLAPPLRGLTKIDTWSELDGGGCCRCCCGR